MFSPSSVLRVSLDVSSCLGLGTKDHVLIDLVHTHTNAQMAAIKKKWEAKVGKATQPMTTQQDSTVACCKNAVPCSVFSHNELKGAIPFRKKKKAEKARYGALRRVGDPWV